MTTTATPTSNAAALHELWSRALGVVRNTRLRPHTRLVAARAAKTLFPSAPHTSVALGRLVETMLVALDVPQIVAELGHTMRRSSGYAELMNGALLTVATRAAAEDRDRSLAEVVLLMLRSPRPYPTFPAEWIGRAARAWIRAGAVEKLAGLLEVLVARHPDELTCLELIVREHPRISHLLRQRPKVLVEVLARCPTAQAWSALAREAGASAGAGLEGLRLRADRLRGQPEERRTASCVALEEALRQEPDERCRVILAAWLVDLRG